jgi:hypothetical protein
LKLKALIRVYGPPYLEAIAALERVALENPEICLMNPLLYHADPYTQTVDWIYNYFKGRGKVSYERCGRILAKAEDLDGYDFVFVWMLKPTRDYVDDLIKRVDEALKQIGVMYSITFTG